MKHLFILGLSFLLFTGTIRAQVAQQGNVRIYNSHKTPLAGVQLLAAGGFFAELVARQRLDIPQGDRTETGG